MNVTGGWHETRVPQLTANVPAGAFVYLARGIKEAVNIPVFASNRLGDPQVAERALRSGSCDMICWGRPLIADPDLSHHVSLFEKEGRLGGQVNLRPNTRLLEIRPDGVRVDTGSGEETLPADTVVMAAGVSPVRDLSDAVQDLGVEWLEIGDANRPGKITEAVQEGFLRALTA